MKVVGIGGGTGLPVLLSGLKALHDSGQESIDITAIVTVSDSGGSTGALREAFQMPAMGDIRKCVISLAAADSLLTSVYEHRFENPEGVAGHALGNLILSALYQMSGNFAKAVRQSCELLHLKGRVLPSTENPVTLCALYEDGRTARGECNIPKRGTRIRKVWLETDSPPTSGEYGPPSDCAGVRPDRCSPFRLSSGVSQGFALSSPRSTKRPFSLENGLPPPAPGVLQALENADAIVVGPGSLYTSLIPNLLVAGVVEAIATSRAIKIYINNLMTQPGETDGYSAAAHVRALLDYVPAIDVCILNSSPIGMGLAERYVQQGSCTVSGTADDENEVRQSGVVPVAAPLLRDGEMKARHDPETLARLVVSLTCGFTGAHEIICGQWNWR